MFLIKNTKNSHSDMALTSAPIQEYKKGVALLKSLIENTRKQASFAVPLQTQSCFIQYSGIKRSPWTVLQHCWLGKQQPVKKHVKRLTDYENNDQGQYWTFGKFETLIIFTRMPFFLVICFFLLLSQINKQENKIL